MWQLWLSPPQPVASAAAGGAGCLVIEATAIHARDLNAGVFERELVLSVAFSVARIDRRRSASARARTFERRLDGYRLDCLPRGRVEIKSS